MGEVLLTANGIHKAFGPTIALGSVDFTLKRGEVHGLIGENGSGKSTLASIIAGIQKADTGTFTLRGNPYLPGNAVDAQEKGVAMIVQEMGTAGDITVAENIFLGKEKQFIKGPFVSKKAMVKAAGQALATAGITHINPALPTFLFDMEDRKLIELAKAVNVNPDVLIVDETTTALSHDGRALLYTAIENMKAADKGVIFISHDLDELVSVCNMLTVLRDGVIIGTLQKEEFDRDRIKAMMVGRELQGDYYRSDYDGSSSECVVLKAEHITGAQLVEDVSLELHGGEILGIGGLAEGGMHELGRLLFGIDKCIIGEVRTADGCKITSPSAAVKCGIGYISKNRDQEALMLQASIKDNIVLASLRNLSKRVLISQRKERRIAQRGSDELGVKCRDIDQQVRFLSGGNKQKVVFGKWVGNESCILILDCPTRGVDVGVKQAMYQRIYRMKTEGCSIVLISEELPELIGMSDRILILKRGRIAGEYARSKTLSEHDLIQAMI